MSNSEMRKLLNVFSNQKLTEGVLDDTDDDGWAVKSKLYQIAKNSIALHKMIQDSDELEPWILEKVTQACDYLEAVNNFIEYNQVGDSDINMALPPVPTEEPNSGNSGGMDAETSLINRDFDSDINEPIDIDFSLGKGAPRRESVNPKKKN